MKMDTVLNLTVVVVIAAVSILLVTVSKYNASRKLKLISNVENQLQHISNRIQEYHRETKSYPESLDQPQFRRLLEGLSIVDPFDPKKGNYRYKTKSGKLKIYSIGPNKIDDGGISRRGDELLDIVVELDSN